MAAYAEGLNILHHANVGNNQREIDAETTPLRNPEYYQYDLNLADVALILAGRSVIALLVIGFDSDIALLTSRNLSEFGGRVLDSGEERPSCDRSN
ncbi:hypothetical protein LC613_39630 [Nostoc sphaeroides CHAB 2801]|uniref:hypothetical protein n=1 Tax=Nostoc sphaeroides TaxID=446679 RepID=UPI001E5B8164|nr:hypothetical protein [Nostoc sphaeroides]MCC5633565.1 hypothetical protein [Nostoc sphaeroides CHAB 2801]